MFYQCNCTHQQISCKNWKRGCCCMTESIDQYVLHGVKHASRRTESTGKYRKCVIWFLLIMVSMQHLQFNINHSNGQHFSWVRSYWGCKQASGMEKCGLSAMHEMTGRTFCGFFVFTKWQWGQCQVFTVIQANQKLLALGSGWHEWCVETNLLHSVMIKDVEEPATHFTFHPSYVQRAR